jgi:hypothetical protein
MLKVTVSAVPAAELTGRELDLESIVLTVVTDLRSHLDAPRKPPPRWAAS